MSVVTLRKSAGIVLPEAVKYWWQRVEASPLGYRLASGAFWSMAGTLASRGFALVASLWVARLLGKSLFGQLGMIQNTVIMLATFAGMALGATGTRFIAEYRVTDPARAGRIRDLIGSVTWMGSGVVTVLLLVFAPWVARWLLAAPELVTELRISSLYLLFVAANTSQAGVLAGFEAFRSVALINLWTGLATLPAMVAGAACGGVAGALWALAGVAALTWFLNHRAIKRVCERNAVPYGRGLGLEEKSVLWTFGIPACLGGILVVPVMWVANTFLVHQPNGYGEMGLFNAAAQWRNVILFLPGAVAAPLLAVLSHHRRDQAKTQGKALLATQNVLAAVLLPAALVLIVGAPWLLRLYGAEFRAGHRTFVCVVAATAISAIGSPAGTALGARDKMWVGFALNLGWAVLFLGLAAFLVPRLLANGLGWSLLIANCGLTAGGYFYQWKSLPSRMIWNALLSMAVLLGAAIWITQF